MLGGRTRHIPVYITHVPSTSASTTPMLKHIFFALHLFFPFWYGLGFPVLLMPSDSICVKQIPAFVLVMAVANPDAAALAELADLLDEADLFVFATV